MSEDKKKAKTPPRLPEDTKRKRSEGDLTLTLKSDQGNQMFEAKFLYFVRFREGFDVVAEFTDDGAKGTHFQLLSARDLSVGRHEITYSDGPDDLKLLFSFGGPRSYQARGILVIAEVNLDEPNRLLKGSLKVNFEDNAGEIITAEAKDFFVKN